MPAQLPTIANSMTIYSLSGSYVNHREKFGRGFADGEIPNFPQVLVNGVPITTQVSVKKRWPSGDVRQATIVAEFPLVDTTPRTVTFQDMPTANDAGGLSLLDILDPAWDFEVLVDAEGPTPGSMQTICAEDAYTLAAPYTRQTDTSFIMSLRAMAAAGYATAVNQGPLMTEFTFWDPSKASNVGFNTPRSIMPRAHVRFWPDTMTYEVDLCLGSGDTQHWEHQHFTELQVFLGDSSPVLVHDDRTLVEQAILNAVARNNTISRPLDPGEVATHLHASTAFWFREFSGGTARPADVVMNHNLQYLTEARIVPGLALFSRSDAYSLNDSSASPGAYLTPGSAAAAPMRYGQHLKASNGLSPSQRLTGNGHMLGPLPHFDGLWLHSFHPDVKNAMLDVTRREALVPGYFTFESQPGRFADSGDTLDAYGLPITRYSRSYIHGDNPYKFANSGVPQAEVDDQPVFGQNMEDYVAADGNGVAQLTVLDRSRFDPVYDAHLLVRTGEGAFGRAQWEADDEHAPIMGYVPYVCLGSEMGYDILRWSAAYFSWHRRGASSSIGGAHPHTAPFNVGLTPVRAFAASQGSPRAQAWAANVALWAAQACKDSDPLQPVFEDILDDRIVSIEGMLSRDGDFLASVNSGGAKSALYDWAALNTTNWTKAGGYTIPGPTQLNPFRLQELGGGQARLGGVLFTSIDTAAGERYNLHGISHGFLSGVLGECVNLGYTQAEDAALWCMGWYFLAARHPDLYGGPFNRNGYELQAFQFHPVALQDPATLRHTWLTPQEFRDVSEVAQGQWVNAGVNGFHNNNSYLLYANMGVAAMTELAAYFSNRSVVPSTRVQHGPYAAAASVDPDTMVDINYYVEQAQRVQASGLYNGGVSPWVSGLMRSDNFEMAPRPIDGSPPAAPQPPGPVLNLQETGNTATTIDIAWDAPQSGDPVTTYSVLLDGVLQGTTTDADRTFEFTGLTAGTGYTARVVATNAGGASQVDLAVMTTGLAAPGPVQGLAAANVTQTAFDVVWSAPVTGGAPTLYRVWLNGVLQVPSVTPPSTGYSFSGLSAGTEYLVEVEASNASGATTASLNVTTAGVPPVEAPGPVQNLKALGITSTQATISWGAPSSGGPVDTYRVELDGSPVATFSSKETTYTFLSLTPSTNYTAEVIAVNAGGESAAEDIAIATPAAPASAASYSLQDLGEGVQLASLQSAGAPEVTFAPGPMFRLTLSEAFLNAPRFQLLPSHFAPEQVTLDTVVLGAGNTRAIFEGTDLVVGPPGSPEIGRQQDPLTEHPAQRVIAGTIRVEVDFVVQGDELAVTTRVTNDTEYILQRVYTAPMPRILPFQTAEPEKELLLLPWLTTVIESNPRNRLGIQYENPSSPSYIPNFTAPRDIELDDLPVFGALSTNPNSPMDLSTGLQYPNVVSCQFYAYWSPVEGGGLYAQTKQGIRQALAPQSFLFQPGGDWTGAGLKVIPQGTRTKGNNFDGTKWTMYLSTFNGDYWDATERYATWFENSVDWLPDTTKADALTDYPEVLLDARIHHAVGFGPAVFEERNQHSADLFRFYADQLRDFAAYLGGGEKYLPLVYNYSFPTHRPGSPDRVKEEAKTMAAALAAAGIHGATYGHAHTINVSHPEYGPSDLEKSALWTQRGSRLEIGGDVFASDDDVTFVAPSSDEEKERLAKLWDLFHEEAGLPSVYVDGAIGSISGLVNYNPAVEGEEHRWDYDSYQFLLVLLDKLRTRNPEAFLYAENPNEAYLKVFPLMGTNHGFSLKFGVQEASPLFNRIAGRWVTLQSLVENAWETQGNITDEGEASSLTPTLVGQFFLNHVLDHHRGFLHSLSTVARSSKEEWATLAPPVTNPNGLDGDAYPPMRTNAQTLLNLIRGLALLDDTAGIHAFRRTGRPLRPPIGGFIHAALMRDATLFPATAAFAIESVWEDADGAIGFAVTNHLVALNDQFLVASLPYTFTLLVSDYPALAGSYTVTELTAGGYSDSGSGDLAFSFNLAPGETRWFRIEIA